MHCAATGLVLHTGKPKWSQADGEKMKSAWMQRFNTTFHWALTGAALALLSCSSASPGFGGNGSSGSQTRGTSSGSASGSASGDTSSGSGSGTTDVSASGSGSGGSGGGSGTSRSGSGSGSSSGNSSGSSSGGSAGSSSGSGPSGNGCGQTLPALSDYSKNGPFTATPANGSTGPGNAYTVVAPTTLGKLNGAPFKHPIITWGNGITTTPSYYPSWFSLMASNGFVVIASNSSSVTPQNMTDGLDWMVQQNSASGPYQGVLDTKCLFTVGYSLGGGGAVTTGSHADVVATIGIHPAAFAGNPGLKGPLLLFTAETDTVCVPATSVHPAFAGSPVQSFYADLSKAGDPSNTGHIIPVTNPGLEQPGTMAWLRLWAYGDQGGKAPFWGSSATLCQAPWTCESKQKGGTAQMSGF
jgi:hypothetical protein